MKKKRYDKINGLRFEKCNATTKLTDQVLKQIIATMKLTDLILKKVTLRDTFHEKKYGVKSKATFSSL